MRKQSIPRIDSIPPELCTRKEAAQILGLKHANSVCSRNKRYAHVKFAEVVYNGKRLHLYNRKQIESLTYPIEPDDYITAHEASILLNYCVNTPKSCSELLVKHSVPRKLVACHHSYYVYSRKAVEALREKRANLKKQKKNGLDKG